MKSCIRAYVFGALEITDVPAWPTALAPPRTRIALPVYLPNPSAVEGGVSAMP